MRHVECSWHAWVVLTCAFLDGASGRIHYEGLFLQAHDWQRLARKFSQQQPTSQSRHHHLNHHHNDTKVPCATTDPTLFDVAVERVRSQAAMGRKHRQLQLESCDNLRDQTIEIQVNLHLTSADGILLHPNEAVERLLDNDPTLQDSDFSSQADLEDLFQLNVDVLNAAFADTPFFFTFMRDRTTVTDNFDWTTNLIGYTSEISQAVGSNDLKQLDVFAAFMASADGALGMGVPGAVQRQGTGDGVYINFDVMTGGGFSGLDMGYILVHEVGHWFGLHHTFATMFGRRCDRDDQDMFGDFIDDTPVMDGPTQLYLAERGEDCRDYLEGAELDTCPRLPGPDPMFNYMNYLLDTCLDQRGEFTCNQVERIYLYWLLFRDVVTSCDDPLNYAEIELVFVIDSEYESDGTIISLFNDDAILFDTIRDHWIWYQVDDTEGGVSAFEVDMCIERDKDHYLVVTDWLADDGFADGSVSVYIDGTLAIFIDGRFEEIFYTITFSEAPIPAPTEDARVVSLMERIAQLPALRQFEAFLNYGFITPEISGAGPFTLMVPWNFGFDRLDPGLVSKLQDRSWGAHLQNFLRHHMYAGDMPVDSLQLSQTLMMQNGEEVTIIREQGTSRVRVNDVLVLAFYDATNGAAYMLDDPLLPSWLENTLADLATTALVSLSFLTIALGLEPLLADPSGDLTIFAPSDEAFAQLGEVANAFLASPEGEAFLQDTVRYHLVPDGPFPSMYFTPQTLATLHTSSLTLQQGDPWIVQGDYNSALITELDKVANNGLIHIIDTVLLVGILPV